MAKQQEKAPSASSRKSKAQKTLKKQDGDAEAKPKGSKKEKLPSAKESAKPKQKASKQAIGKCERDGQEPPRGDGAKGTKSKSKAPRQAQSESNVAPEASIKQKEPRKKSSKQPKNDALADPRSAAAKRGRGHDRQTASNASDLKPQVPFTPRSDAAPFIPSGNAVAAA